MYTEEEKDVAFIHQCIRDGIKNKIGLLHGSDPTPMQQIDTTLKVILNLLAEIEYKINKREYGL